MLVCLTVAKSLWKMRSVNFNIVIVVPMQLGGKYFRITNKFTAMLLKVLSMIFEKPQL